MNVAVDSDVPLEAGPPLCADPARTPLSFRVQSVSGDPNDCVVARLVTFEGMLVAVEPLATDDGVRLVVELSSAGASRCAIDVGGVGSDVAARIALPAGPIVGQLVVDPALPDSALWIAAGASLAPCAGESRPRYPLVFFAADGLALNSVPPVPGVVFDLESPPVCRTAPTTNGCGFCGTLGDTCWSWGTGLVVQAAIGCGAYGSTTIAAGETLVFTDPTLRGRLRWGLFSRECAGTWLPDVGRGAWLVWRELP